MRGMKYGLFFLAACGLLLDNRCSPDSVAGGTSTSENGRVVGRLVTTAGAPASNTQVTLIPASYNPVKNPAAVPIDTTDDSGGYSFTRVGRGDYVVQSVHVAERTRVLRCGIRVAGDTVTLPADTLRSPGSIKIALPEAVDAASGYVYIPGTTIFVTLYGGNEFAVLDSVPAGIIPAVAYASEGDDQPSILRYAVVVRPEDTAIVRNTSWKYSRRLRLNTSSSGAGINETVHRFPVLVRLTEINFDFNEARSDGADLLFTKTDAAVLPGAIERWDAGGGVAELWVQVDTIRGNDSVQSITMYWGNPQAVAGSGSGDVFDTAAGFDAVWHLGESFDTLYDATSNRYHGIRHGNLKRSSCMIGYGQIFDSTEAYCEMGTVLNPGGGDMTVSAWVKRSATGLQTIVAKSNGGSPNATYGWSLSFGTADQVHFFTATAGQSWGDTGAFDFWSREDATVIDSTAWHYIVAVVDRSDAARCRTYIDGVDVTGGSNGDIIGVGPPVTAAPLRIGAEADGDYQWTGSIDECVVSRVARPEAWIRLCFINQGPDDRLVEFR
ncbi:MAG: DUF2341 domain-containing protein [Chitinispirillaceae bacterium]|nr:DUF2341 domain-containing protein [Chitinispirillaceae bacterium]